MGSVRRGRMRLGFVWRVVVRRVVVFRSGMLGFVCVIVDDFVVIVFE